MPLSRTYEYISVDNIVRKTDRNGRVTEYEYDHLNRIKSETWYDGQTPIRTISYAYDDNSNLVSVTDPSATYYYQYDKLNRSIHTTQTIVGLDPDVQFYYTYDDAGRMLSTSSVIDSTADFANQYEYDHFGNLTKVTQTGQSGGNAVSSKRVDFTYNAANQLTGLSRYASLTTASPVAETEYGHDGAGRLTSIAHTATASGSTFAETHSYTYDGANRITSYSNVYGGVDAEYAYDATDQLTGVDYTGLPDESYAYDANGNRQSAGGATYSVGSYNRLLSDGTYRYEYDYEGNRVARFVDTNSDELWSSGEAGVAYTWDHRNRLAKVTFKTGPSGSATKVIDYAYDAFNELVYRKEDPDGASGSASLDKTVFVHDGGQVVLQFNKMGSGDLNDVKLSHRYLWAAAVDQLLADEQATSLGSAGAAYWTLSDHLGSVRDVVDPNGKQRIHRAYDAFGNVVDETHYNASGATVNSGQTGYVDEAFAFTGRWFDQDTSLQNNVNRWYDPAAGRWTSQDPSGFPAGDANLYRYVGNQPTNRTDPSGLEVTDEAMQHGVGQHLPPGGPFAHFEGGGLGWSPSPFDFFAGIGAGARGFCRLIWRGSGDSGIDLGGSYPPDAATKPVPGGSGGSGQTSSCPDSTLDPAHVWHGDPHAPGLQWDPTVPWKRPPQLQR